MLIYTYKDVPTTGQFGIIYIYIYIFIHSYA
jgi:hypothetical protein